jgi:peptide/nickel transport system permease protein
LPGNLRWGAAILLLLAAAALVGPRLAGDPARLEIDEVLRPPGAAHWLGTDGMGRDMAARVVHGARVSLAVGLLTAGFTLGIGVPLGALAGYLGGWADAAVSRLVEAMLCLPTLLLMLALAAASPTWFVDLPDVLRIALVLGLTGWMPAARYLRAEFMRLVRSDMVLAARACGAGHLRLIVRHILPSALAPVLVTAAFAVGAAIGLEAALSYLGYGVGPPVPTWGGLLAEAQFSGVWWLAVFPGVALFLTVLACNLVGEGVRDLLDPRVPSHRP